MSAKLFSLNDVKWEYIAHQGAPKHVYVIYEGTLQHYYLMEYDEKNRFKDNFSGRSITIPEEYLDNVACRFLVNDETVFITTRREDATMYIRYIACKLEGKDPDVMLSGWEPIWKKEI